MMPLYDMLEKAGGGRAMEELAHQYGLTLGQAQDSLAALLPAFSEGLKRNASDPYGIAAFLTTLSTGRHAGYFSDPASAFSPAGRREGDAILSHLFGTPEVSSAVAAGAAQMTGIAQETLRQMLPALAAMIMGGLYRQAMPGAGAATNPLQEIMRAMASFGAATPPPRPEAPQPGANMFDNPFMAALNGMFAAEPRGDEEVRFVNPFARMFEEMTGAGAARAPEPPKNPSGRPRNTYDDLFGQMFETGRQTRADYESAMRAVFERHAGGG